MPSRIVRDTLLESDRWLSLAHPAERLAYIVLLLKVDDLATADATDGQLVRLWREPCNVKGPEDALRILNALADADLVRIYEAGGKRLAFIPRFRQRFRACTFRRPPPPESLLWDEPEVLENIRQIKAKFGKMSDKGPTDDRQLADNCPSFAPVVVVEDVVVDEKTPLAHKREGAGPDDPLFDRFWLAYPKKRSKGDALKAWKKLRPNEHLVTTMLAAIERAKTSEQWRKNGGQFIPYPATWLNARGWEDEIETSIAQPVRDRYVKA